MELLKSKIANIISKTFHINSKTFNINSIKLITKINYNHLLYILTLIELDDGRLVSGSGDYNIIIYNKRTFKPDIIIKEHQKPITCLTKLNSNKLISCSYEIKIFKIKHNNYEILQILEFDKSRIFKIIELKNKNLISCTSDQLIMLYSNNNDNYQKDYQMLLKNEFRSIIQTKETEICCLEFISKKKTEKIIFYDFFKRGIISKLSGINSSGSPFNMITTDLLVIGGRDELFIINVNKYEIVRSVKIDNHGWYNGFCMLNENMFLTGGSDGIIRQWKIKGDNINLISKKENVHDNCIYGLIQLRNGNIASCSLDRSIKIWCN